MFEKENAIMLALMGFKVRRAGWHNNTVVYFDRESKKFYQYSGTDNSTKEIDINKFHLRDWSLANQSASCCEASADL